MSYKNNPVLLILIFTFILMFLSQAQAGGPTGADLDIEFVPDTIGPGSNSRLVYTFTAIEGGIVTNLGVTNTLPAGVTLSSPSNPFSDCNGAVVSAPNGDGTISISDISLAPDTSCKVEVNVTSSMIGTFMNSTGNVTSSSGTGNTASADLMVVASRPGFSKSFLPTNVTLGSPSTLTFTVDNTANASGLSSVSFTDVLPTGMIIANPTNVSSDCGNANFPPTITAVSGSNQIDFSANGLLPAFPSIASGTSCTISVDVIAGSLGILVNQSDNLVIDFSNFSGFAVAELNVSANKVILTKDFIDDPIVPGGTGVLRFTVLNTDRSNPTSNMAFTDDLGAALSGLVAIGLPQTNVCGVGSSLTGTGFISLTGGSLPPEGSCSFDVTVQVPVASVPGQYINTTSFLSGDLGGNGFMSSPAVSNLFVEPAPILTKEFTNDPVGAGSDVTLEFTVTNSSTVSSATDITFVDNLANILPGGTVVTPISITDACGPGSNVNVVSINPPPPSDAIFTLTLSGGNLAASGSCTFSVVITVPIDQSNGVYTNVTESISATVAGQNYTGEPATDDLVVVAAPQLSKEFTDDPVTSGSTTTLEFTLSHDEFAPGDATNITFTDDLSAVLTGLSATGLPMNDICGMGSSLSGTTNLSFTGGSLAPGETCTFSVVLDVPAAVLSGSYTNTTSIVTADVLGVSANGNFAQDDLNVANITFSKEFLDDPVIPGQVATLRFTIDNTANLQDTTNMFFTDNLQVDLPGLAATGLPITDICGVGSTILGTNFLIFTGGNLLAGESCVFDVDVLVPLAATSGSYANITSNLTATTMAGNITLPPATDALNVSTDVLLFSKEFIDDPVFPGDNVTLEFTIENLDPNNAVTNIGFSDDLDAALTGLVFDSAISNTCGGMGGGMSTFTYSGGSLAAGSSCTIQISLIVPSATITSTNTNTVSDLTGMIGMATVNGNIATDDLLVNLVTFSKSFDGPSTATGTPVLTYTITNLDASNPVNDLQFNDDFDAVITGLVATGLPSSDDCGMGSQVSGTSLLTFTGGNIPASGMCQFSVGLLVPSTATAGDYPSVSSDITIAGLMAAIPASADLNIQPAPTFTKLFAPNSIGLNQNSTLTFNIDNSASALDANNLSFTDDFPNGIIYNLGSPVLNTCGGTVDAINVFGASSVSLMGGSVTAGSSCSIQVSVAGSLVGAHINTTSDLASSSGNSGTASDTLVVNPQPGFSKSFAPDPIFTGGVSTLSFVIDNSASTVDVTALNFSDNLPAGLNVANPSNATTTCTGGTLTAVIGSQDISYTSGSVSMASSCTVSVDVLGVSSGNWVNLSGDLTSSLGNSGTATDSIDVNAPPLFNKSFAPNVMTPNDVSTLTFLIQNTMSTVTASGLDFTDNLPAGVEVAALPNASTTCSGGTITAVAGTAVISYSGGSVNSGASCEISVDVTSSVVDTHMNLTGDLTSNHGNSGSATANLVVTDVPVFSKIFSNNPYIINSPNTLTFVINNNSGLTDVSMLGFTDMMPSGFTVANPSNVSNTCDGGLITATPGTDTIVYSGGNVFAGSNCSITVDVVASQAGSFTNTTSVLTTELGDGNVASAMIDINAAPTFTKQFTPDVIIPGAVSSLSFNIDNSTSTADATGVDFTDNLPANLVVATPANGTSNCGGTLTAVDGSAAIGLTGGLLTAGTSCEITVDVTSSTIGTYINTTEDLTSSLGNSGTATDTLIVTDLPVFTKAFSDVTTTVNTVNTLTFTIDNSASSNTITGIGFTDTMPTQLVVANPANIVDNCTGGTVTAAVGTNIITYAGGSIAANSSCTIAVDVLATSSGVYSNITSPLMTDLGNGNQATADVTVIDPPLFDKSFSPNVISPDGISTLIFAIDNSVNSIAINNFAFVDNLPAGMVVATNPNVSHTCTNANITAVAGSGLINVTSGTAQANASCQINVDITSSTSGFYTNVTGDLTSDAGNSGTATADLNVTGGITFTKSYDDIVVAGGTVNLSFVLENNTNTDASNIAFSDDLSAVVLASATNLPINNACGTGSQMISDGNGLIQLSTGVLAVGESCQIDVVVQIDASVAPGTYTNTTSQLSADFGVATIVSGPASDDFTVVAAPSISKSFNDGSITSGDLVELTFTITNNSPVEANQITFSDDLDAFISGSTAVDLPQNDLCGTGSSVSGTSVVILQNGILPANSSCQFTVTVMVPIHTQTDLYTNITSAVSAEYNGMGVTGSNTAVASATLYVASFVFPVPMFSDWKIISLLIIMMLIMANFVYYRPRMK